jgi:(2Fe-2S) ferredoxin
MSTDTPELPAVFRHHVFCCYQQRPPGHPRGSCGASGAAPLWEHLGKQLQARQLSDIGMAATGCLGFCNAGPLMVVYPAGVWYQVKTAADIDEIVQTHLVGNAIVERLAVILQR